MTLYHVQAEVSGENADFFIRAESPREAYEHWRRSDLVSALLVEDESGLGADDLVTIWRVPPVIGAPGVVEWQVTKGWAGKSPSEFPAELGTA